MSDMTQIAISEYSFAESELHTLDESIDNTSSKLKAALTDVVALRKQLRELLVMKKENAIDQINKAKQYFESVETQENELSDILGEDGARSPSNSHHKDGDAGSLKSAMDLIDRSQNVEHNDPEPDLKKHSESLEGHPPDLVAVDADNNTISRNAPGDDIPAYKDEKDESIRFLENPSHLQGLDNAALKEAVTKLEEEVRRRCEARARDMLARADEELKSLRAEKDKIRRRLNEISTLEGGLYVQRTEGERLASEYAPPKTLDNKKKTMLKRKGRATLIREGIREEILQPCEPQDELAELLDDFL